LNAPAPAHMSRITDPQMQALSAAALATLGANPVVILAGGTGGHIFPGLAVARALRLRGVPVLWLGSAGGMETRLVPVDSFAIETIAVRGLRGKGVGSLLAAPYTLARAVWQALRVLRSRKPRAVLSFGGFAAGPGGIAAWLLRKPLLVHEQNRAPGLTNRVLARFARRVLTGFPGSFAGRKEEAVGNPVRTEIAALPPPAERFAGRTGALRLLVLGGSQGARAINETVPRIAAALQAEGAAFDIRHQCGEKLLADARAAYAKAGVEAQVEPFIRDMAQAYGWADLVIGRAGALTIAELCAAGVGSLLVPFPGAVDDHQARNAEYLAERGGGEWFRQDGRLEASLRERVRALAGDRARLLALAEAARAASFPRAAERVADIVIEEAAHA
jgi:UDP-N-acetylglucosamine--N-acetylmuramyl-(pentapeptide) pyrophosphoryl-undecaprenol N-acetylglucosamine transferase